MITSGIPKNTLLFFDIFFIFVTEKKSFSHDIIVFAFFNLFATFPHCLGPTQQKTMS